MGHLAARGHELTHQPEMADVIVVNTCSFIDPAKQESVDTILEMAEFKRTGKARRLIVAGCLVERYRGDIRKDMPEVDAILGTNELEKIAALCEGAEEDPSAGPAAPYLYHDLTPRILSTASHYAYVKIAEGCDHPCTFCVIPQYRGNFRSRRFESVIAEATRLFAQGVREINLIGQDTTCYGEDFGLKDGLAQLLARLAQIETPQPKWVRFLYCYPNKVTQKLLDTIAAHEALVKYIDMPLQHASAAGAEADEARSERRYFPEADRTHSRHHSRRCAAHQHDRRLSRRDGRRFRRALPIRESRAVRPAGCFLLFRRGHQRQLPVGWQGGREDDLQPQAAVDGDSAAHFPRAEPPDDRPRKWMC